MLASRKLMLLGGGSTPLQRLKAKFAGGNLWTPAVIDSINKKSDGSEPVTASGDLVGLMRDLIGTSNLIQTNDAGRVDYLTDNGISYLHRATGENLFVASSQALFKPLHDGTGVTILAAIRFPADSLTTIGTTASGSGVGLNFGRINTSKRVKVVVGNGSANVINMNSANTVIDDDWHVIAIAWSLADGVKLYFDGELVETVSSGSIVNSPSSSNSASNLTWALGGAEIDLAAWAHALRVMDATEVALVSRDAALLTGI